MVANPARRTRKSPRWLAPTRSRARGRRQTTFTERRPPEDPVPPEHRHPRTRPVPQPRARTPLRTRNPFPMAATLRASLRTRSSELLDRRLPDPVSRVPERRYPPWEVCTRTPGRTVPDHPPDSRAVQPVPRIPPRHSASPMAMASRPPPCRTSRSLRRQSARSPRRRPNPARAGIHPTLPAHRIRPRPLHRRTVTPSRNPRYPKVPRRFRRVWLPPWECPRLFPRPLLRRLRSSPP